MINRAVASAAAPLHGDLAIGKQAPMRMILFKGSHYAERARWVRHTGE